MEDDVRVVAASEGRCWWPAMLRFEKGSGRGRCQDSSGRRGSDPRKANIGDDVGAVKADEGRHQVTVKLECDKH